MNNFISLTSAFLYKEYKTLQYYKFYSIIKFLFSLVQLVVFYYFCSLISKEYFKFLFFGLLFSKIFSHTTTVIIETIKQEQFSQTIYNIFSLPYSELIVIISSFFAKTIFFFFDLTIFILCGILFFNIKLTFNNLIFLLFYTIYTIFIFLWYTIIICSLTFLIKKSEHFIFLLNSLIDILSGVYFNPTVLPTILQNISYLLPTTYVLFFIREVIITSKINYNLLVYPTICSIIFLPISIIVFNFILIKILKTGKLTSY